MTDRAFPHPEQAKLVSLRIYCPACLRETDIEVEVDPNQPWREEDECWECGAVLTVDTDLSVHVEAKAQ